MTIFDTPGFTALGATSLMARFGDRIDRALSLRIAWMVDRLDRLSIPGLVDVIPSYTTLVAPFDPALIDRDRLAQRIITAWNESADHPNRDSPNDHLIEVEVVYGGNAGPDLDDVADATGLSPEEVIRRHSKAEYTVGALGFSPGFAFLIGLPPEIEVPRRATPRTRVPTGSVGIGGSQTGIYSLPTPGGWSLIGRTPRVMFDPSGERDDELRLGDRVRFRPIPAGEKTQFPAPALGDPATRPDDGSLEIVEAGVQSSVQDLGRPSQGGQGITPGGAADRSSLIAGNRLLGNDDGAAALEWTLLPPAIRVHKRCRIVMTGADPGWARNGDSIATGEHFTVEAGDEIRAPAAGRVTGARGYICVGGGIDVPVLRGSRSLDLSAGFGGGFGRPLQRGDNIAVDSVSDTPNTDNVDRQSMPGDPSSRPFRVLRGPQADRFDSAAWATFLGESYTIDAQSNRMGLRLNGPAITPQGGADVISEGVVTGAIQVTGGGQPIVLLPGRATIGGYTKIATVIEADHDRLAQLRPGSAISFAEVSLDEAEAAWRAWQPSVHGGLAVQHEGITVKDDIRDQRVSADEIATAWTPDGVIAVIRELANHDVQAFSLRVESAGLEIAIDRGGGIHGRPGREDTYRSTGSEPSGTDDEQADNPSSATGGVVTAPLLGTFYRRPSPEEPVFVNEGDTVEAGQVVGLIEVMKTFNEVAAEQPGVIGKMLVEEGATVEFGTPLMELASLAREDRS